MKNLNSRGRNMQKLLVVIGVLLCDTTFGATAADSLFNQARIAADTGKYPVALECLETILADDSTNTDALLLKGLVYLWQQRFDSSTLLFKKVISIAPAYRDAWISLVNSYARNNQSAAACSTCRAACIQFESDTELVVLSKKVCSPTAVTGNGEVLKDVGVIEAHAGMGGTLFEQSYNRFPWGALDCGVDISRNRWGIETVVRAERRKYGTITLYGGEVEVAPRVKLRRKLTAGMRFTLSPYLLVDTLFASRGVTAEVSGGLPGGMEIDGEARLRWYGLQFSQSYSCGIGKYLGHYLAGGRLFFAAFENQSFFSGMIELRRFSSGHEAAFGLISVAMGRTPYEAGTLTRSGYLSFIEGTCRTRMPIRRGYSVLPAISVAGEQVTQHNDVNNDGVDDLRRSAVRMKTSLMMTVVIKRSLK